MIGASHDLQWLTCLSRLQYESQDVVVVRKQVERLQEIFPNARTCFDPGPLWESELQRPLALAVWSEFGLATVASRPIIVMDVSTQNAESCFQSIGLPRDDCCSAFYYPVARPRRLLCWCLCCLFIACRDCCAVGQTDAAVVDTIRQALSA